MSDYARSFHYDSPLPRRRKRISTDRILSIAALFLAAVSLVLGLLN